MLFAPVTIISGRGESSTPVIGIDRGAISLRRALFAVLVLFSPPQEVGCILPRDVGTKPAAQLDRSCRRCGWGCLLVIESEASALRWALADYWTMEL